MTLEIQNEIAIFSFDTLQAAEFEMFLFLAADREAEKGNNTLESYYRQLYRIIRDGIVKDSTGKT